MKLNRRQQKLGQRSLIFAGAALAGVICLFPFYYALITSLRSGQDLFQVAYLPSGLHWGNYVTALMDNGIARSLLNSIAVATLTVGLCLLVSITAAFALARIGFRGRKYLLFTILCVSMFPQVAVLSGMFELVRFMGLYDSLGALVLSYTTFSLPFTVWVLTTFMKSIPVELEEAAIVDGAGTWTIISRIFAPIMGPSLVTTGLLAFIGAWNEFMFALTFVISSGKRTVPVAIGMLQGASQFELPWGTIMAASVIVTLPIIALVLIFQRRIVSGLTHGAVKG
ncbi:carbohydrate ABC transporter permease [Serratia ficaria]|uniref:carbohydrate ABC transporter permease n=1 Tax=Serratia ficaria TaxID=61651 RepID=UPI002178031C|nr:carbohydrate ABC transporter permease [Serratia ficaria]CAI0707730.1 Inner membrane ABC transporter permease protein ycjP [Serratia ficaria]CAI1016723.1 Inner membrane ABC transporter permease protein ycjP [Serratia ficaria]CAI1842400.1 Inner membrane ABC transporter permease protein ycjP [Serratia ficaria]CAI2451652.1 Inner membrane ABC transporter permease protein ycjP [Serratia ficaria]CAI2468508.1 Inner membrane ABC transporter permease protein ycjP [Serratia ficaria]